MCKGLQKRRRQWGREIGFGFGQRHEPYLTQVFRSRSRCKAEAVLVNSILPGIGNSVGLAKKGERCLKSGNRSAEKGASRSGMMRLSIDCFHRRESAESGER
jgi:hypothetical protein